MHVGLTQLLGATGVSFTAVMEMSEGEYTEQFVCMCLFFFLFPCPNLTWIWHPQQATECSACKAVAGRC